MAHDRPGPDSDRLIIAKLSGTAQRHARWGALTADQAAAGAAELRELAAGRGDLLAEVAGLALGTATAKGPEYQTRARAVAELCRTAGADEGLIPQWAEIGRERAGQAGRPPFSRPRRPPRRP